jgi:hypothetical protein
MEAAERFLDHAKTVKAMLATCQRLGCDEDAVEVVDAVRLCIEHRNESKRAFETGKR